MNLFLNYVVSRKILGFRIETAWRAWRCRQAAHQSYPNSGFCHELPSSETEPPGDARCLVTIWLQFCIFLDVLTLPYLSISAGLQNIVIIILVVWVLVTIKGEDKVNRNSN